MNLEWFLTRPAAVDPCVLRRAVAADRSAVRCRSKRRATQSATLASILGWSRRLKTARSRQALSAARSSGVTKFGQVTMASQRSLECGNVRRLQRPAQHAIHAEAMQRQEAFRQTAGRRLVPILQLMVERLEGGESLVVLRTVAEAFRSPVDALSRQALDGLIEEVCDQRRDRLRY